MQTDPYFRKDNYGALTFSMFYNYSENFILVLSHDEVVHGKKSLMHKMWGDRYKQFAHLRNMYTFQMAHPGKKLLFMGSEWGQFLEWKYAEGLEWRDLQAGGLTSLGEAYDNLSQKLSHSHGFMMEATGSFAPVIILLSDGAPTDHPEYALDKLSKSLELIYTKPHEQS